MIASTMINWALSPNAVRKIDSLVMGAVLTFLFSTFIGIRFVLLHHREDTKDHLKAEFGDFGEFMADLL